MSQVNLPDKPERPLPSDCCNSGCTPCILDVYEDLVKQWEEKCELIKAGVSVSEEGSLDHPPILSQTRYAIFKLVFLKPVTDDTFLYSFQAVEKIVSDSNTMYKDLKLKLDFKPSQYFVLQGSDGEKHFTRAYTPISDNKLALKGCFDVVIKYYPDGKMSKYLKKLLLGDITHWRGPYNGFNYKPNNYRNLLMLCAGTGVAPMYSLTQSIVSNEDDETIIKMLYCCKDDKSIILRNEIHKLCSFWNFSADIYVPHSNPSECKPLYGETLKTVRLDQNEISNELLQKDLSKTMIFICGNAKFCQDINEYVRKCSVDTEHIHIF
ncbi:NADH-cytochrome b5 reductase-like [Frankliniella fusca]|uniref:NADH-cytochrome b5 reductase n=1 Tax=Frankliniella fusca TaxID=407009 RepID=A0AAE1LQA4_9NEOP|nr:NADH-cytochrome b5 reductase-like [Frankliniella fusca]